MQFYTYRMQSIISTVLKTQTLGEKCIIGEQGKDEMSTSSGWKEAMSHYS